MDQLFKIKAEIFIYNQGGRTLPIKTGYRPGFIFINNAQTSGSIKILDKNEMIPGSNGIVEIYFFSDALLGNIKINNEFKFYEGNVEIGQGKVIDVIGWVDGPVSLG